MPPNEIDQMPKGPIDVFFATNRMTRGSDQRPRFENKPHHDSPFYLRYGLAEVAPPKRWDSSSFKVGKVVLEPEKQNKDGHFTALGSDAAFKRLRAQMLPKGAKRRSENESEKGRDALVLIHGWDVDFKMSLARAAEISVRYSYDVKRPLVAFVFSWPSDAQDPDKFDYYQGRDVARVSGIPIARAIKRLWSWMRSQNESELCQQRIHLVAHSMGNYAFRHAIQAVRNEFDGGKVPRIFDEVFLMAADEDADSLEKDYKLGLLPDLSRRVHVYYAADDRALFTSDVVKFNPDRLGSQGPVRKDGLRRQIHLVDCDPVSWTDLKDWRHQYYRRRAEVYHDVRAVLAGTRLLDIPGRLYNDEERSYQIVPFADRRHAVPVAA